MLDLYLGGEWAIPETLDWAFERIGMARRLEMLAMVLFQVTDQRFSRCAMVQFVPSMCGSIPLYLARWIRIRPKVFLIHPNEVTASIRPRETLLPPR